MKRFLSILILLTGLVASNTPNALAHAELIASNPKANANVKVMPKQIWFEFGEKLMVIGDKNPNSISIADAQKHRVDFGGAVVNGARISTALKSSLAAGKYFVSYRVVSEDGHVVNGKLAFTFKP